MSGKAEASTDHPRTRVLALGAIGVVFGDIGTNPLFALREAFESRHPVELTDGNVLGLLSLMFWALLVIVSVKYLTVVMRADNDGEGGILALTSLVTTGAERVGRRRLLFLLGLFGAALLYGDGVITPAISVLAAVEGATIAAPGIDAWVVPVAVVILIGLFAFQHHGTATLGRVFGPIMVLWFTTIGVLGGAQVLQHPGVLRAVNPGWAVGFFADNGARGFLALGAIILVVVGGEALYADLGHFGRRPIELGWYGLVLPSLLLVYFGQGALLIHDPTAIDNPFYRLAPDAAIIPLVVLATMATVIASQALISATYSLTHQAAQLGYLPRVRTRYTSATEVGQIYVAGVNWVLMVVCVALVIGFRESAALAGAYGLAVSMTMTITTVIFYVVARDHFGWPRARVVALCGVFAVADLAFLGATLFKIPDGGWLPLLFALVVFSVLTTWHTGRRLVGERLLTGGVPLADFVAGLAIEPPQRTTAVTAFLFSRPDLAPPAMRASLRHLQVLPGTAMIVSVLTEKIPRVAAADRAEVTDLGHGIHQVILHFGFTENPNVPAALEGALGPELDLEQVTYVLGTELVRVTSAPGMAWWRERLFAVLTRNATNAADYFGLPFDQTLSLGVTVEL